MKLPDVFLPAEEAALMAGFRSPRSIYWRMKSDPEFPRQVKCGKSSAWSQNELQAWMAKQKAKRQLVASS